MASGKAWKFNKHIYVLLYGGMLKNKTIAKTLLESTKAIWSPQHNRFELEHNKENAEIVCSLPLEISPTLKVENEIERIEPKKPWKDRKVNKYLLPDVLFPYQVESVQFLDYMKGRGLIAHDMGLGKTIIAISYFMLRPNKKPVLIVCPSTLKYNWDDELNKWMKINPKTYIISSGNDMMQDFSEYNFVIVNYEMLSRRVYIKSPIAKRKTKAVDPIMERFVKNKFDCVILDECHRIKNTSSNVYAAIRYIKKKCCQNFIPMSGTPILSKPDEFWSALNLVDDQLFPSQYKYRQRYCAPFNSPYGISYNGASNTMELYNITQNIMIRYTKPEVLPQLPKKLRNVISVDISNRKEYNNLVREVCAKEDGNKTSLPDIAALHEIQAVIYEGKKQAVIDYIDDVLDSDEKLVVFCAHTKVIKELEEKYKKICVKIDGSVTDKKKRNELVKEFQSDDKIKLFFGNLKAAGVGLTLTASSHILFVETGFISPGELEQAEDRCVRIGATADNVTITHIVGKKTVEEKFLEIIGVKKSRVDAILEGKAIHETNVFKALFEELKRERDGK